MGTILIGQWGSVETVRRRNPLGQSQCPVCFTPLEVREVANCDFCGGRGPDVEPFVPMDVWRFPNGQTVTLCGGCLAEEFSCSWGWGYRLGLDPSRGPLASMEFVRRVTEPTKTTDKYCPNCHV